MIEQDSADAEGPTRALNDYELATRLSYFLWSSMPDEKLFELAAAGKLTEPTVLRQQIDRMLNDGRVQDGLVRNFLGQWLELRRLDNVTPDPKIAPTWNAKLRADMQREAELFFADLLAGDGSLLQLIDADYSFLNQRLAEHYGIAGVVGQQFRRVALNDSPRGGVLTMAATLTVTSHPTRTSPVKRGNWILEQIVGAAPPPPPPNIPELDNSPAAIEAASLRQRLEQHRADPNCAVCHDRLDPIGFSLENFDAIGMWRDKDGRHKIDPSGTLPDGTKLGGPADLKQVVLSRKDEFTRTFAEKMLTFALGRGVEPYDECTLNDLVRAAKSNQYRVRSVVEAIVTSDAFTRRAVGSESP
jgi:hypothetical protein